MYKNRLIKCTKKLSTKYNRIICFLTLLLVFVKSVVLIKIINLILTLGKFSKQFFSFLHGDL
jgi:hypothetical protein